MKKQDKKVSGYNIGLDIGVGSVGWAATNNEGKLLRKSAPFYDSKTDRIISRTVPMWGYSIFDEAEPAKKKTAIP